MPGSERISLACVVNASSSPRNAADLANWVITTTFPTLQSLGLGLAYGLYTAFAVLSFFFVWKFVSETKGRELEEMTGSV